MVERELFDDRLLRLLDATDEPRERTLVVVERELANDLVDVLREIATKLAIRGRDLGQEARERGILRIERELTQYFFALLLEELVDRTFHAHDNAAGLLRRQQLVKRALRTDEALERLVERRSIAV
jgi:hypothetical protein